MNGLTTEEKEKLDAEIKECTDRSRYTCGKTMMNFWKFIDLMDRRFDLFDKDEVIKEGQKHE